MFPTYVKKDKGKPARYLLVRRIYGLLVWEAQVQGKNSELMSFDVFPSSSPADWTDWKNSGTPDKPVMALEDNNGARFAYRDVGTGTLFCEKTTR